MKKLALISALTILLSACGGGGGSPSSNGNNANPSAPTSNNGNRPISSGWVFQGPKYVISVPNNPNQLYINGHVVEIDGKTYDLSSQFGANINGWRHQSANIVTGTQLPDIQTAYVKHSAQVQVGLINPKNSAQFIAYFNGLDTHSSEMPTTGTAKYDSQFAFIKENNHAHQLGRFEITADFGNKKLSSSVISGTDIQLNAKITGNTFESSDVSPTTVQGGFFGPNASEIAGGFQKDEIIGAFHGVKQ